MEIEQKKMLVVVETKNTKLIEMLNLYFVTKNFQVEFFQDLRPEIGRLKELSPTLFIFDWSEESQSNLDISIYEEFEQIHKIVLVATGLNVNEIFNFNDPYLDILIKSPVEEQILISVEKVLYNKSKQLFNRKPKKNDRNLITSSPKMLSTLQVSKKVAASNVSIFITGESGSGKEVVARYIHAESPRSKGPFIAINCSAIPETLLESELFGHSKGAFTGAVDKKIGLFEEAEDGTLFLDEIGDLSQGLQAKLLRVLQEKKIKRIGENEYREINARIISATHKDLLKEVEQNKFREDLFFRLNVVPINVPSLRDRPEDILPLANYFMNKFSLLNNYYLRDFSEEAQKFLLENEWKGNVRELENSVERAVVMCSTSQIELNDFLLQNRDEKSDEYIAQEANEETYSIINSNEDTFKISIDKSLIPLQHVVKKYIEFAVNRNGGAKDKTAKQIGIDRKTLYRKMKNTEQLLQ